MQRLVTKPDGSVVVEDIPAEEQAARLIEKQERQDRFAIIDNKAEAQSILNDTDWTQIPNNGLTTECVDAFTAYRAAVRVIRQGDMVTVEWPVKPELEWT